MRESTPPYSHSKAQLRQRADGRRQDLHDCGGLPLVKFKPGFSAFLDEREQGGDGASNGVRARAAQEAPRLPHHHLLFRNLQLKDLRPSVHSAQAPRNQRGQKRGDLDPGTPHYRNY